MALREKDPVSGTDLTGHEWDGIKELDTPVPWAARWSLWGSIAVAAVFWVFYPSFPTVRDYAKGALGYSSRAEVMASLKEAEADREQAFSPLTSEDIEAMAADSSLEERYGAAISKLYADNCAACHTENLKGQPGFPNLADGHWLWSGSPEEIEYTIRYGINAAHDETRIAQMLAFGADGMIEKPQVKEVTEFVLSLSGQEHDAEAAEAGRAVFEENCAACHGEDGRGGYENGAPNLGDGHWIYGGGREDIYQSIYYGRQGVMPAWEGRLSDMQIRMLTLYLLWNGENAPG
ncbi:cytochrome-c oxidase, cbb3-type subunit III [Phaeobacter inhibens]|uniref:cytochrome-c oxidase, cbb3-type subunit III n=1 Tax=Phaeobacter inhibens TaxID=221822 RepID=UPI0021A25E92|nr:cytochrome-c oxidase, cbb3-type subunit III [Phaeobacter inhibens]UWR67534.1 cytochrome-c oxidase, cbb3-type subunit III [Phaeobacter inhibens]UWR95161.1 cytochrome-c oxidase, cbb3-type subunit III [Phaeobacter inhibens]